MTWKALLNRADGSTRTFAKPTSFGLVEAFRADPTFDARPREIRMRRIVHHELGQPAQVLQVEDGPSDAKFVSAYPTHRSIQAIC